VAKFSFPKVSLPGWVRVAVGVALVFGFLLHEAEWVHSRFIQQRELWAYDGRLRLSMPKSVDPRGVRVSTE